MGIQIYIPKESMKEKHVMLIMLLGWAQFFEILIAQISITHGWAETRCEQWKVNRKEIKLKTMLTT